MRITLMAVTAVAVGMSAQAGHVVTVYVQNSSVVPNLALAQVRVWRKACDGLARTFDEVLRDHLEALTGSAPW